MKYNKRRRPPTPHPEDQKHITLDLSFRVGRRLTREHENILLRMLEEATCEAVRLPRRVKSTVIFQDGEMIHVRIKIKNSPAMLVAYTKRTFDLGEALRAALKEFNNAYKK